MVKELLIEQGPKSPHIELNQMTGDIIFFGKSIPENPAKVYEPVLSWVSEYLLEARPVTNLRFKLEYFNTSTLLWLTKIIKLLTRIDKPDYTLIIHLYMSVDDFEEINDYDDIKDLFLPIAGIDNTTIPGIGIKLYGTNENDDIVKEMLVLFDSDRISTLQSA